MYISIWGFDFLEWTDLETLIIGETETARSGLSRFVN